MISTAESPMLTLNSTAIGQNFEICTCTHPHTGIQACTLTHTHTRIHTHRHPHTPIHMA